MRTQLIETILRLDFWQPFLCDQHFIAFDASYNFNWVQNLSYVKNVQISYYDSLLRCIMTDTFDVAKWGGLFFSSLQDFDESYHRPLVWAPQWRKRKKIHHKQKEFWFMFKYSQLFKICNCITIMIIRWVLFL